jgi:hypothetical protein
MEAPSNFDVATGGRVKVDALFVWTVVVVIVGTPGLLYLPQG